MSRLRSLSLAGCLALSACLPPLPERPDVARKPVFDPVAFFTGPTHGEGTLLRRFAGSRALRVEGLGTVQPDGSFALDQIIMFANGTVESRRWVLTRRDATHYSASLSDAQGDVSADVDGTRFHLKYRIRSPRVYMEQWLDLQPDGRAVLNQAQVTVLGIPWARLSESIQKLDVP